MLKIEGILNEDINIASLLDDAELIKLGSAVAKNYDIDLKSRSEWAKRQKISAELARQVTSEKTFPFENASNIKFPLVAIASLQFGARTYPAIIQGPDIVKANVNMPDPDGRLAELAQRKADHMNNQLKNEMPEWEEGEDILTSILPVLGTVFKKSYFDAVMERNVSELIMPADYIVDYWAKPNKQPDRGTQRYYFTLNEIIERERSGLFLKLDDNSRETTNNIENKFDDIEPYLILEQHCLIDLDSDGYKEPYVVTVCEKNKQVLRIIRRFEKEDIRWNRKREIITIDPEYYFTKFPFLPSLDGGYYGYGFGDLLGPVNDAIDSTINQLLDAGALANMQSGFIGKGARIPGGSIRLKRGEWLQLEVNGSTLRENIVNLNYGEPSSVLFSLLGLLIEQGDRLSSVASIMSGQSPGANTPVTTVLTMVEQGMQLFTAIQKRIYRSRQEEIYKLCRLNRKYMNEVTQFSVDGMQKEVLRSDYEDNAALLVPVADPTMVSSPIRMAKAQALRDTMGDPGVNRQEIQRRYYEALGIPNIEAILPKEQPQPGPDPALLIEKEKLDIEREKLDLQAGEMVAKIEKLKTAAILDIARAEGVEAGTQIDQYKQELDGLKLGNDMVANQPSVGGIPPSDNSGGQG